MGAVVQSNAYGQIPRRSALAGLAALAAAPSAFAASASRYFTTSDGVKLHYLEAGPEKGFPIVFVPGWTMPAWMFEPQLAGLSVKYRCIALDPRGQGKSALAPSGYEPIRRGRDLGELIMRIGRPVVVVGWSLGVLDALSYIRQAGDRQIAGLVLVDNSIGEGEPPEPGPPRPQPKTEAERAKGRAAFVAGMFARDPGQAYRSRLTADSLRMGPAAERALLSYPVPREAWRETVHGTDKPVLYVVRPKFLEQAQALVNSRPNSRFELFEKAGHALFVDEPQRFNALVAGFMSKDVGA